MGKQSSRLIYRGKDIKDLVYQGNYLNKLYKGGDLVWEKLYKYFVQGGLVVFDLESKKYIVESSAYSTSELKTNATSAIALLRDWETNRRFFAISYDMLSWKKIEGINTTHQYYYISASYDGFFVYTISQEDVPKKTVLYFVEIDFSLEYTVKEIYYNSLNSLGSFSLNGISDYFYGIRRDGKKYILCRIWKNGKVEEKQLMGNFIKDNVNMARGGIKIIADGIGNAFLICYDVDATNGGTVIFKVQNMDTENIYTVFWCRNSKILNGAVCGIDIVYDSYQTLFIAHRGFAEEPSFVENRSRADGGYYNMEFHVIDQMGNVLLTSKERNKEIKIKCFGIPGRDYLTIKFGGAAGLDYRGADIEGYIHFYNITKGITSNGERTSCIFDYDKEKNDRVFVGSYSWRDGYTSRLRNVVIFIDNLYLNESENNFIVATYWQ